MAYPTPPESKSSVRRAGLAVSEDRATADDFAIIERWRASHAYVINTFQAWLKGHLAKQEYQIEFAQRLKRRNTVLGKLRRTDLSGRPLIRDLSSMHDFAGCRMIFDTIEQLHDFRRYLQSSKVMRNVEHELRNETLKYDYIEHPKATGYRGIHDVYKHFPRGTKRREEKKPWDSLLVEIQFRTRAQHAWATAVEISDLIDGEQTKFELDQSTRGLFFSLASEIIARGSEGIARAFPDKTLPDLRSALQDLEQELGILRRLALLKQFEKAHSLRKHNVLNIRKNSNGDLELEVLPYAKADEAIAMASKLENNETSLNAVYVRSDNPSQLRSAYRNYFYDPVDFVEIIQSEGDVSLS